MRSLVPKLLIVAIFAVAAFASVPAAGAAPTFSGSFKVSAKEANNAKIIAGPDGAGATDPAPAKLTLSVKRLPSHR